MQYFLKYALLVGFAVALPSIGTAQADSLTPPSDPTPTLDKPTRGDIRSGRLFNVSIGEDKDKAKATLLAEGFQYGGEGPCKVSPTCDGFDFAELYAKQVGTQPYLLEVMGNGRKIGRLVWVFPYTGVL